MRPAPAALLLSGLLLSALPAAIHADALPMTAAEFDAYATGKTLTYSQGGEIFGTEQYLPNRRVRWAFTREECRDGYWYEEAGLICFVYEHDPTPQCWSFWQGTGGLTARFNDDPAGTELSEVEQTTGPLICAGPDVGV
ncbi:MAG TPA: hypothetical protein VGA75_00550 [Paracoccaceae bacterium]